MRLALLSAITLAALACGERVKKTLRITWEDGAPNGQLRKVIYTNGQLPGPPLIFTEGDDAEITIVNELPRNLTIHWHGVAQLGTPWSDGVPGLSQKPIPPGGRFVYRFKASPVGTHWYHSHERMTLADGLYGAILIKPREEQTGLWAQISNDPEDVKAMARAAAHPHFMVVSDWSRFTSDEYWRVNEESGLQVFILVNGMGEVYCQPLDLLINQTQPGIQEYGFGPTAHVTDKGCFPFRQTIQGGPWNYTARPEIIPPHMVDGCVPSRDRNATIQVDATQGWASLNFISAATNAQFIFSIDAHDFWIYEIDGNYVVPKRFVTATMSAGETFSAMVRLDKPPGVYTIRVPDSGATQVISGFADMAYKGWSNRASPEKPHVSYGGISVSQEAENSSYVPYELEHDLMPPWPPSARPRPGPADEEFLLVMGRLNASINYTMNTNYLYPINFKQDQPLLFYPNSTLGTPDENLVIRTKNGSWVDLILQISTLPGDRAAFEHFMHKHGSKTWRIGFGRGVWNYSSVVEGMAAQPEAFNLENPGYRDTWLTQFSTLGGYWSVLRYQVDNPGPWLFHCHIELHKMGGMAIAILDGVDAWPEVPLEYQIEGHRK